MADAKPTPANVYNVDQSLSINSFFDAQPAEGEALHLQITTRFGASVEQIVQATMNHVEALAKLRATYPKPTVPVPTTEPVRVDVDDSGNEIKSFVATELVVDLHDGKLFTKVKGGNFTKFGIAVWPEVLETTGLEIVPGKPAPDIRGWRVEYKEWLTEEGKRRQKVTALGPSLS